MRSPIILTILLSVCASTFSACQKEFDDDGDAILGSVKDFRAKVNGVQFVSDISGGTITNNIISLAGKMNDGQMIAFSVVDSGEHVYNLTINNLSNVGSYLSSAGSNYFSNEGATSGESGGNLAIISLDRINRVMSGTFNLKVFRQADQTQRVITEGVFTNIPF